MRDATNGTEQESVNSPQALTRPQISLTLQPMLTLDITPFRSGFYHVTLDPAPDDVDLEPETFHDLHVEADLQCHRDRIVVDLDVEGYAKLTCDRTLQTYDQPLSGGYTVLFGPPSMAGDESEKYDEIRALRRTDREIDLTDIVRDTLRLAIPHRRVAPGAEEESIQTTFGEPDASDSSPDEGAVDPRWSALESIRDELPDDAEG
jgi:uncharacterized protein